MSENDPTIHSTVEQSIDDVMSNIRMSSDPAFSASTQSADIEGRRLTVHATSSDEYCDDDREVVASNNTVDRLGKLPEPHIPGNDRDLGLRFDKATLSRYVERSPDGRGGAVYSSATVETGAGFYQAREGYVSGPGVIVERDGYGKVEIKNPRARQLVANLAAKTIKQAQEDIQEVKGKELVQDRKWLKKARRSARRVAGKKTQEAA